MSISRADVAAHLHDEFDALERETKQAESDDSANGYGPVINQALAKLSVAPADRDTATVADADEGAYYALADYFALSRFARKLATKVDTGQAAMTREGDRNRIFDNVQDLLKEAKATLESYGYSVGADDDATWTFTHLPLDYIEPEPA